MRSEDIVGIVLGSIALVVVLPRLLRHKLEMAKVRSGAVVVNDNSAELVALRTRCEALEKRCEKLEEQVVDAHAQLADERRQLDTKLASMLPESFPTGNSAEKRSEIPVKTMM
jgi:hypothetical protein